MGIAVVGARSVLDVDPRSKMEESESKDGEEQPCKFVSLMSDMSFSLCLSRLSVSVLKR
jgi:hypothetical protein